MSRFYVGQRVKLVNPAHPVNMGITGVIRELFEERPSNLYAVNCDVSWDKDISEKFLTCTHTSRLEPLTDSYDVTTWDSCVWKPEHLRVGV